MTEDITSAENARLAAAGRAITRIMAEREALAGTLSAIRYRMTGGNIALGRGLTQLDCEHVLESINEALSAPADSPNRARAANHEWRWIISERPGEVTLTCDCSSVWKHFPIPVGMTMMLPPCPGDDADTVDSLNRVRAEALRRYADEYEATHDGVTRPEDASEDYWRGAEDAYSYGIQRARAEADAIERGGVS
jgi:hypothetical protein